ncbi:uncharacterized protein LOC132792969 [Drosophila nasuta]|nr:uncharacterized protein LOC132792969 [Drosophila nasuta]
MCGFGFMAYGFDCCHRSIDFPLMPSIGTTEIKVKCKVLKSKLKLKRQNKQFVMLLLKTHKKRRKINETKINETGNKNKRKSII